MSIYLVPPAREHTFREAALELSSSAKIYGASIEKAAHEIFIHGDELGAIAREAKLAELRLMLGRLNGAHAALERAHASPSITEIVSRVDRVRNCYE